MKGILTISFAATLLMNPLPAQDGENIRKKLLTPILEEEVPRVRPLPPLPGGITTKRRPPEVPAEERSGQPMPRDTQPPEASNPVPATRPISPKAETRPAPAGPGLTPPVPGLPVEVKRPRPNPGETARSRIPAKENSAPVISVPPTPQVTPPAKQEMTVKIPTVPQPTDVLPEELKKDLSESKRISRARIEASGRADAETTRLLQDRGRIEPDHDAGRPRKIENEDDARGVILSILGGTTAGAIAGNSPSRDGLGGEGRSHRLSPEQVGRAPRDRELSVEFLSRRFRGRAQWNEAPPSWRYEHRHFHRDPYYFGGNRRVVYYHSYASIPPILLASHRLHFLQVTTVSESPYRVTSAAPDYDRNLPEAYRRDNAYAVSYAVDPDSAVILDDILFAQGSTNFADAYSYDLVVDLAEAMNASEVARERFVVEGHASAEGGYNDNLVLSQARAERIARDLVAMGVAPERLVPVGYGETEARFPENSPEQQRGLDRRVLVFRLTE